MSILLSNRNLLVGNGDLFVVPTVADLPTFAQYKNAYANGTAASLPGNIGAIKGTATVQLSREIIPFELGVPQEIYDQTAIREGCIIKVSAAEFNLSLLASALGAGVYATLSGGSTEVVNEIITIPADVDGSPVSMPIQNGPILNGSTTPTATAPLVKLAPSGTPTGSALVSGTDYLINYVTNTVSRVPASTNITAAGAEIAVTYYYNQVLAETLAGGGSANVATSAVMFVHPYKDGRIWAVTLFAGAPTGNVSLGFEEAAYSHPELEFRGQAQTNLPQGQNLYSMYRER